MYRRNPFAGLNSHSELLLQFGKQLRSLRTRAGMSQIELSRRAGVQRSYLSDTERGARNISLRIIARLAAALNLSPSELFAFPDESPNELARLTLREKQPENNLNERVSK